MPRVESSNFNSESTFYSPKSSVQTIQVALVTITLIGGVTATFALIGYLPSVAVWPGAIGGGVAFIGFAIITVKQCCRYDYVFLEGEIPEEGRDLEKSVSIKETSKQDKFFLIEEDDDYDFVSESESVEFSRSLESEPEEQLCDPFTYHNFGTELALKVLSLLDAKSLLAAGCVNWQWRVLACNENVWKVVYGCNLGKMSDQMVNFRQECIRHFQFHYEQKQRAIVEEDIFSAASLVKNPSIKRIEMGTIPDDFFITDSFLVSKIAGSESHIYNLSHEKAKPTIAKTCLAKIKGKPDQIIEVDYIVTQENEKDRYQFAKLSSLKNKEFAILQGRGRRGYKTEHFLHSGNYVNRIWISKDKTERVINHWDASTEKTVEFRIPCRVDSIGDVINIIQLQRWGNQLVCAYADGVREFWDLTTLEKKEFPSAFSDEWGVTMVELLKYSVFEHFEIMQGNFNRTFLCIRDLQTEEIVFSNVTPEGIYFSQGYKNKVIFIQKNRNVYQFDLKEKKVTPIWHLERNGQRCLMHGGKLLMGSRTGEVAIWDLEKKECLYRKQIFKSKIDGIDAEGTKIAVSCQKQVAILDFSLPDDTELVSYR